VDASRREQMFVVDANARVRAPLTRGLGTWTGAMPRRPGSRCDVGTWNGPAREKMRDGSIRGGEDPCPTFGTPYAKGGLVRIGRKASKSTVRRQERYARRPRHPEGYPGSFSCPYSPECVEGKFCERRPNSVLGSSATRVSEVRVYLRLVSVGVKGFCRAGRGFCSDSKVRCL
jgi:hypothetical protein